MTHRENHCRRLELRHSGLSAGKILSCGRKNEPPSVLTMYCPALKLPFLLLVWASQRPQLVICTLVDWWLNENHCLCRSIYPEHHSSKQPWRGVIPSQRYGTQHVPRFKTKARQMPWVLLRGSQWLERQQSCRQCHHLHAHPSHCTCKPTCHKGQGASTWGEGWEASTQQGKIESNFNLLNIQIWKLEKTELERQNLEWSQCPRYV